MAGTLNSTVQADTDTVLALCVQKNISFSSIQSFRTFTNDIPPVIKLLGASDNHREPAWSNKQKTWDPVTQQHKIVRSGGWVSYSDRVIKATCQALDAKLLEDNWETFPLQQRIIPAKLDIDRGGGFTKLVFSWVTDVKPNGVGKILCMYEDTSSTQLLDYYFSPISAQLQKLETEGFEYKEENFKIKWFKGSDYEGECDMWGHGGANCKYNHLWYLVTDQQFQESTWEEIKNNVNKRTSQHIIAVKEQLAKFLAQPEKKGLISCTICGEFHHNKKGHTTSKATAKCATCGQTGHWRNSSSKEGVSGMTVMKETADCSLWSFDIQHQMKVEALAVAKNKEPNFETYGIKSPITIFDWIPIERTIPPVLHITNLGADQRWLKIIEGILDFHDKQHTNTVINRVESFKSTLYDQLHVYETSYHGGSYDGNHISKIFKHTELVISMLSNLPEKNFIMDYLKPLLVIDELANKTEQLASQEISKLRDACVSFGKIVRSAQAVSFVPINFRHIPIKYCLTESVLYQWAEEYHTLGSFSESGVELTHHNVNKRVVNTARWMAQQLHYNILTTCPTLRIKAQAHQEERQRGQYSCGKCRTHGIAVKKTGHICPYK